MAQAILGVFSYPRISVPRVLHRARETVALWRRRMREREELSHWTERDIRDAGMTRAAVEFEMSKPFWRD